LGFAVDFVDALEDGFARDRLLFLHKLGANERRNTSPMMMLEKAEALLDDVNFNLRKTASDHS
jgi:hypothetical protein